MKSFQNIRIATELYVGAVFPLITEMIIKIGLGKLTSQEALCFKCSLKKKQSNYFLRKS